MNFALSPVRRRYVDLDFGQLHYRDAGTGTSAPPLLMLHGSASSTRLMLPLIASLAAKRRVVAIDTPGNGESDPLPQATPTLHDFAHAAWAAADAIGLTRFDLYGTHFGLRLATEMSLQHPERIGRLILDGEGVPTDDVIARLIDKVSPELIPDHDGVSIARAWQYVRDYYLFFPWFARGAENRRPTGLPEPAIVQEKFIEILRNGQTYGRSYRAGLRYPLTARLSKVTHPTLISAAVTENVLPYVDALCACVPHARKAITPGIWDVDAVRETARIFTDFLDESLPTPKGS